MVVTSEALKNDVIMFPYVTWNVQKYWKHVMMSSSQMKHRLFTR